MLVHEIAAIYYMLTSVFGFEMSYVRCTHCGWPHLDKDFFSVHPHQRHLCAGCGRHFRDSKVGIGNPIMGVMRDFNRDVCPLPGEYDDERRSVEDHIANYVMNSYSVGPASVTVNFGGTCAAGLPGDACASSRVMWSSTGPNGGTTRGTDHLTAVYSQTDQRWWLCSSRYAADTSFGASFYSGK